MTRANLAAFVGAIVWIGATLAKLGAGAQLPDTFFDAAGVPALAYATQPPHDVVAQLNEKLAAGSTTLSYEPGSGYLRSVLSALDIPVESQLAVFSKTSVQARIISPVNPRTLFLDRKSVV